MSEVGKIESTERAGLDSGFGKRLAIVATGLAATVGSLWVAAESQGSSSAQEVFAAGGQSGAVSFEGVCVEGDEQLALTNEGAANTAAIVDPGFNFVELDAGETVVFNPPNDTGIVQEEADATPSAPYDITDACYEEPAPTTTEEPAPTTTEEPAPTTTEEPAPTTTEEPAPTTTEEPAPTPPAPTTVVSTPPTLPTMEVTVPAGTVTPPRTP